MLVGSGRLIVAVVGAVVLVVAAVFIVRAMWWPTFGSDGSSATSSSSSSSSSASSETTTTTTTSGASESSEGSGDTTPTTTTEAAAAPFSETSLRVDEERDGVDVDVEVPQVDGGEPAVATSFNQAMDDALATQLTSMTSGTLTGAAEPESDVRVGDKVLSGLLSTVAQASPQDNSVPVINTVVIDKESGSPIALSDVFTDTDTGLSRLVEESQTLGPQTTDLGADFDGSGLTATAVDFEDWTAEQSGMRVYFDSGQVGPTSAGIIELTIGWDDLSDVMKPEMAEILSS